MASPRRSTKTPPAWVQHLDPSPDWTLSTTAEDGGWQIEARWWGMQGESPAGPREVVIRQDPASSEPQPRGITTGTMRRMERLLGPMVAEVQAKRDTRDADRAYRKALEARVKALPEGGPRAAPEAYYPALLQLFDEIEVISAEPINDLAGAMGVSKETVNTRLRVARQRRREGR